MNTQLMEAPVQAPARQVQTVERTTLRVSREELAKMIPGVDYTAKLEVMGKGDVYAWHRERENEVTLANALLDQHVGAGHTIFDVSAGLDNAVVVRGRPPAPEATDLLAVPQLIGG